MFVWLSFYAGIVGSGSYLVSLYFNNLNGMFVGWLIILILKSGFHIAHAERPLKLWRMVLNPRTSWISRGLILTACFIVFGAVQLFLSYRLPGAAGETAFKALTGIMAFALIIYSGFTVSSVNSIPFWNSALLPVLFLSWSILSGLALVTTMALGSSGVDIKVAEAGIRISIIVTLILMAFYLWNATYAGPTARHSVRGLTKGLPALLSLVGVGLCGIIIPLALSLLNYLTGKTPAHWLSILVLICEVVGGLSFTYCVLKLGFYSPLIPGRV
jgi:formate-dependent nitrite reductase membrane component NrfD